MDFDFREYNSRWLRKRFFDHELVAYADVQGDEIINLVLIEKNQTEDFGYCNLLFFPKRDRGLLKFSITEVSIDNPKLTKVKLRLRRDLIDSNEDIVNCGFELELCIRKFIDNSKDILSYAYMLPGESD